MTSRLRLFTRRARDARLAQVAGSLTFTTVLSLVPLLTVGFALFTRFPAFARLRQAIEDVLLRSLLPPEMARTVLRHLGRFADNAHGLTWAGSAFLLLASLALMLTVENALNDIWQVRRGRPLWRRLGLYLLMLAVGPPVLGASLWATSQVLGASQGWLRSLSPWMEVVLTLGPAALTLVLLAALFHAVPHAPVRWRDAMLGGLLGSVVLELGKRGFAAYVLKLPTYTTVYGAFAAVPVFLLWVYFSWLVTLGAALVAASVGKKRGAAAGGKRARAGRSASRASADR